jgi:glycosyltransferase involved in cell wall biosynthesis
MPKLCYIATVPSAVCAFLNPHIQNLASHYKITVATDFESSGGDQVSSLAAHHSVKIPRPIAPLSDLRALWRLWQFFRGQSFDIVHSVTPKAGLLGMVAARLAGVPVRIHWFTGQVWATRTGLMRLLLKSMDRLLGCLATHLLADSPSQRAFLLSEGICAADKITVLGDGSICGVDLHRFRANPAARAGVRAELAIPESADVVLYLGRLSTDKGLVELMAALTALMLSRPNVYVLVVGPDEADMSKQIAQSAVKTGVADRVHCVGYTNQPERYMAAADVFCLPSYREGFGSVVIEAAASGVPCVATRIYGLSDAVEDGKTGLLVAPKDAAALAAALAQLLDDTVLRQQMGAAAMARASERFPEARITTALRDFYEQALDRTGTSD